MSFIETVKNVFKPKEIVPDLIHPTFGNMMAEVCGEDNDFWHSEIIFEPLKRMICINVPAGPEGPNEKQVQFFNYFLQNYKSDFNFVSKALCKEYEDWFQKKLTGEFQDNFAFSAITIPKDGDKSKFWELSFDCLADKNDQLFTAEIRNGVINHVRVDG